MERRCQLSRAPPRSGLRPATSAYEARDGPSLLAAGLLLSGIVTVRFRFTRRSNHLSAMGFSEGNPGDSTGVIRRPGRMVATRSGAIASSGIQDQPYLVRHRAPADGAGESWGL